ncbi:acyltransferase family protein [Undibacterium sp.]|uniref:acyltransferase family protein n=1 Tax=Undibacterium sp. TaxID=1914977 RepID=UPI00374D9FDA
MLYVQLQHKLTLATSMNSSLSTKNFTRSGVAPPDQKNSASSALIPPHTKTSFLPELESLRGLAAFAVVVEHSYLYMNEPAAGLFQHSTGSYPLLHWLIHVLFNGRAAVVLFFVLSGFVLKLQLDKISGGPVEKYSSYFVRRIFRIVPTMWVSVFIAYAVAYYTRAPGETDIPLLIKTLAFQDFTLNSPLWSLNVEMGCSLVFPVLYVINQHVKKLWEVLFLIPLAALIFAPRFSAATDFARYLVFFQLGFAIHTYGLTAVKAVRPSWRSTLFVISFLVFGVAPQLWAFDNNYFSFRDDRYYLLLEIPACFYFLSYIVHEQNRLIQTSLNSRLAKFLGKISFSLYLLHFILVSYLWPRYGTSPQLSFLWPYPLLFQTIFFFIIVSVSIPVSRLAYQYIELPSSNLGRHLGRSIQKK